MDIQSKLRLEPDAVLVNDAHDGNRHMEQSSGEAGDPVERPVRGSVEYLVPADSL